MLSDTKQQIGLIAVVSVALGCLIYTMISKSFWPDSPSSSVDFAAINSDDWLTVIHDGTLDVTAGTLVLPVHDPECKAERLYPGESSRTATGITAWVDAKTGASHYHDPNTTTTVWSCSEGCAWIETGKPFPCFVCRGAGTEDRVWCTMCSIKHLWGTNPPGFPEPGNGPWPQVGICGATVTGPTSNLTLSCIKHGVSDCLETLCRDYTLSEFAPVTSPLFLHGVGEIAWSIDASPGLTFVFHELDGPQLTIGEDGWEWTIEGEVIYSGKGKRAPAIFYRTKHGTKWGNGFEVDMPTPRELEAFLKAKADLRRYVPATKEGETKQLEIEGK